MCFKLQLVRLISSKNESAIRHAIKSDNRNWIETFFERNMLGQYFDAIRSIANSRSTKQNKIILANKIGFRIELGVK